MVKISFIVSILLACLCFKSNGQSDSVRTNIIEGITKDFLWQYVSFNKAKEITGFINQKFKSGGYDTTLNIDEFTYELTKDLRNISKDEHIIVTASHYKRYPVLKTKVKSSKKSNYRFTKNGKFKPKLQYVIRKNLKNAYIKRKYNKFKKRTKKDKFSYGQIKILPGNVGYFEIYDFESTSFLKKQNKDRIKFRSVMRFLKSTNAIIIDLRANTGGYVFLSNYFASFFINKPNSYFITTKTRWILDTIPNGRDTIIQTDFYTPKRNNFKYAKDKHIYVLTSKATFSAAELTSYTLKKLSDVEIIGEHTRGGGNGHYGAYNTKYYSVIVPCVTVYDKERNYTIETKGINPDTLINAEEALEVAYSNAFKNAGLDTLKTKSRYFKGRNETKIVYRKSIVQNLPDYIGDYRKVKISIKDNKLLFAYDKHPEEILKPKSKDNFKSEHFKNISFQRDNENKIVSIQIRWFDNFVETYRIIN